MIHEVDAALRRVVERAVDGAEVEVSFDAPTGEWSARRTAPTISVYLYDIRQDLARRDMAWEEVRDESGRVVERRPPVLRFNLSFLVTAWTQRPEDEHRLLSAVLAAFIAMEAIPEDLLTGSLADAPVRTLVSTAMPPPQDRSISDVWSALGGDLKPSVDVVVSAPLDPSRSIEPGPPVTEPLVLDAESTDGTARERRQGRRAEVLTDR